MATGAALDMPGGMGASSPRRSPLGGHPPPAVTWATRALQLAVAVVMFTWIWGYLGGVRLTPRVTDAVTGANDTGQLFNWHPILLTLAFPVLMAEAVLAYKVPLLATRDRDHSKLYHFSLHTAALACVGLGVAAAFRSHTAKRPVPTPNLYSAHSWLGLAVLVLLAAQYLVAAFSYLWPKVSPAARRALGPLHRFLGKAIFTAGLATMAVGIQEKATFVQVFGKPASLHAAVLALPATLVVLLLLLGLLVLYHHAPAPPPALHTPGLQQQQQQQQEVEAVDGEQGLLLAQGPGGGSHTEEHFGVHSA